MSSERNTGRYSHEPSQIATRDEWLAARKALLAKEKDADPAP